MCSRNPLQGMNWIRREKRLAIYLRDGLACAYCGEGIEDGAQLTLDHLRPNSKGGSNEPANLVTACRRCNTHRGVRPVRSFCRAVAEYTGRSASEIERTVRRLTRRTIDVSAAREMIARRGWTDSMRRET